MIYAFSTTVKIHIHDIHKGGICTKIKTGNFIRHSIK